MQGKLGATRLIVVFVFVFCLCACSKGAPSPDSSDKSVGTKDSGENSETTDVSATGDFDGMTINVLRPQAAEVDWMQETVVPMAKEELGITINVDVVPFTQLHDKMSVELASGSGTYDLLAIPEYWYPEFNEGGWIEDLTPYVADSSEIALDDITPSLLDFSTIDNKLLGIPWKFNQQVLFYNTDYIQTPPVTWEEWLESVKDNTKDGVYGMALTLGKSAVPDVFLDLACSNGASLLNEDNTAAAINSPEALEALEFLMELSEYSAQGAMSRHWDETAALMGQGQVVMDVFVPYVANTLNDQEKSDVVGKIKYAALPKKDAEANASASVITTWNYSIAAQSQKKDAAFAVLELCMRPDVMKTLAMKGTIVPSRISLMEDPDITGSFPHIALFKETSGNGMAFAAPQVVQVTSITEAVANNVQNALSGTVSPKEALEQMEKDINAQLQ